MSAPEPTPETNPLCGADPLARDLAKLRPAPAGVDVNRLLFEAGRVARDRDVTFWRRASLAQLVLLVAFGCAATVFLVKLDNTPPQVVERVRFEAPAPPEPEEAPPPRTAPDAPRAYPPGGEVVVRPGSDPDALAEYLRIRREVLTAGLGLLPDAKPRPAAPVSTDDLEKSLGLPPKALGVPQWQPRKSAPKTEPMPDVP
jgi:hypothetical protein